MQFYDMRRKQFTTPLVPLLIFSVIMGGTFILGIFGNVPTIFYVSFFSLAIAAASLFHDQWFLNSLVIPAMFLFGTISVLDAINLDVYPLVVHAPTLVISIIVSARSSTSLFVMTFSSALHATWVYAMKAWLTIPFYGCTLGICDPATQAIIVFIGCMVVAVLVSIKNAFLKKMGSAVHCDGGYCPW